MKKDFTGIFRGNEKGFGFVKIENQEDEIYISKNNSNNALKINVSFDDKQK